MYTYANTISRKKEFLSLDQLMQVERKGTLLNIRALLSSTHRHTYHRARQVSFVRDLLYRHRTDGAGHCRKSASGERG